jgi:hypothetical protein
VRARRGAALLFLTLYKIVTKCRRRPLACEECANISG